MARSYPAQLYVSAVAALMGACSFGYHLGVLNTSIQTVSAQFGVDELWLSPLATCAMLAGAAAGSILAGGVADQLGPKRSLLLNNIPLCIGALVCAAAWGPWSLCLGRLLAGLGSGAASLFVPRYVAEISPKDVRGALGTLTQVFINVGILASYLAGLPYQFDPHYALHLPGGAHLDWWRCMMLLSLLPSALQVLGSAGVPESPVWLTWAGHHERAQASVLHLHGSTAELPGAGGGGGGGNGGSLEGDEDDGRAELLESEGSVSGLPAVGARAGSDAVESWSGMLLKRRYRWVVTLVCALPVMQQLSGINTVIFYSTQVFATAGLSSPIAGTLVVGAVNLCFTFVASALMDRTGRKTLLLTSHSGMAACLLAMVAAMVMGGANAAGKALALATFGAILGYIVFFALGVGPIPWLYIGEVLPDSIKGKAGAMATSLNWVTNLVVGLTFPRMLAALGIGGSYGMYAAFNLAAVAFFSVYMVETRQQSLSQIKARMLLKDKAAS